MKNNPIQGYISTYHNPRLSGPPFTSLPFTNLGIYTPYKFYSHHHRHTSSTHTTNTLSMCIKNFTTYRCGCTLFRDLTLCSKTDHSCAQSWAAPDPSTWGVSNSHFLCQPCFGRSQAERKDQPRLTDEQVSEHEARLEDSRQKIRELELATGQRELDARVRELEFARELSERHTQVRTLEHAEDLAAAERRVQFLLAGVELRGLEREVELEEEHRGRFLAQQRCDRRATEAECERKASELEALIWTLQHEERMAALTERLSYLQAGVESRALREEIEREESDARRFRSARERGS